MRRQKSILRLILEPILVACVLAIAVRATLTIYSVPSASMAPSLRAGDHIVVTRFLADTPARGDVIVFHNPADARALAIKRVIALPGDLVESVSGRVHVGGRAVPEPYAEIASALEIAPQLVPSGHLFVLGDNRLNSVDSRHWGAVPREQVIGRARVILWSSAGDGLNRIFKWIE